MWITTRQLTKPIATIQAAANSTRPQLPLTPLPTVAPNKRLPLSGTLPNIPSLALDQIGSSWLPSISGSKCGFIYTWRIAHLAPRVLETETWNWFSCDSFIFSALLFPFNGSLQNISHKPGHRATCERGRYLILPKPSQYIPSCKRP